MVPFFFALFPIAQACPIKQSKSSSLLSQLALSPQKFFPRSPKLRREAETDQASGSTETDPGDEPGAELESEGETSEGLSPTEQFGRCFLAGLDYAVSDLVSLDSQAEVDEGTL